MWPPPTATGGNGRRCRGERRTALSTEAASPVVSTSSPDIVCTSCSRTTSTGFVGSHLCEALVERGDHVLCLDSFFTGSRDNVAHLLPRDNFELIRHDVVNPILLARAANAETDAVAPSPAAVRLWPRSRLFGAALPQPNPFPRPPTPPGYNRKSTRSTIWPAQPHPSTTSTTPSRRLRRAS